MFNTITPTRAHNLSKGGTTLLATAIVGYISNILLNKNIKHFFVHFFLIDLSSNIIINYIC